MKRDGLFGETGSIDIVSISLRNHQMIGDRSDIEFSLVLRNTLPLQLLFTEDFIKLEGATLFKNEYIDYLKPKSSKYSYEVSDSPNVMFLDRYEICTLEDSLLQLKSVEFREESSADRLMPNEIAEFKFVEDDLLNEILLMKQTLAEGDDI